MTSQSEIAALLKYDPDTGYLIWRSRPGNDRVTNSWNAKHAGRRAGCVRAHYGYRGVTLFKKVFIEHRLVWLLVHGEWPAAELDHVNGVKGDNRICNLRLASRAENTQNQRVRRDNLTGLKGVQWRPDMKKFHVRITVNGARRTVGWFGNAEEAHAAYWKEAQANFGKYARAA